MQEKVGKRSWVNVVIIVFLVVLLILTFFSNTIRNRNLSECTTATVGYGSIDSKVRGSGTVSARESYELKASDTRKVKSVLVRNGQTVTAGEVLLILEAGESTELSEAEEALRQLKLNYQRALITATTADYTLQNREIESTQTQIDEATAARDALGYRPESVSEHETNLQTALDNQANAQKEYDEAQKKVDSFQVEYEQDSSSEASALKSAKTALDAAKDDKDALFINYGAQYHEFLKLSKGLYLVSEKHNYDNDDKKKDFLENDNNSLSKYQKALADEYENSLHNYNTAYEDYVIAYQEVSDLLATVEDDDNIELAAAKKKLDDARNNNYYKAIVELARLSMIDEDLDKYNEAADDSEKEEIIKPYCKAIVDQFDDSSLKNAYDKIQAASARVNECQTSYDEAYSRYLEVKGKGNTDQYNKLVAAAESKKSVLDTASKDVETKQAALDKAKEKKAEYDGYNDTITQLQKSLDDQLFNLEQQKKADGKTQTLEWMDISEQKRQLDEQQEKVDALKAAEGESGETEVTAPVAGVIRDISISPGSKTGPDAVLMNIEIKDMGYSLSFSVTNEQAKLIRKGDTAELTNMWWGGNINAEVSEIKSDPQNPRTNKMIYFTVTGDVSDGDTLDLSVGQRSAEFDSVIPKAALKSDNNGDFVYVVTLKSSPLGNRYIAERVNVEVVARDDKNIAVSGSLDYGAYVIVNSSLPIQNGSQVRLAGQ